MVCGQFRTIFTADFPAFAQGPVAMQQGQEFLTEKLARHNVNAGIRARIKDQTNPVHRFHDRIPSLDLGEPYHIDKDVHEISAFEKDEDESENHDGSCGPHSRSSSGTGERTSRVGQNCHDNRERCKTHEQRWHSSLKAESDEHFDELMASIKIPVIVF